MKTKRRWLKMINILYISWTEKMSGGEISFINYVKALDKTRFNPIFLCPKEGKMSERLLKEKIPVRFLLLDSFSFRKPWKFFISVAKLATLIKKEKIALIHNTSYYSNQLAVIAGKICNIPVITHGQSFTTAKEIRRNLLSYADKIITCSYAVKNNLLPYVKEDAIEVMWHAIKIPTLKKRNFSLHKELGLPRDYALVGHIGLLEPRKRQEDIIKAAQLVLKRNKKVRFLIVGNSQFNNADYDGYLHLLAKKLKVEKMILFLGFREDLFQVIQGLDIVMLPSINEPFSLVMIEAMAFGKPFVGSDSGGTSEFIHHNKNGLLIPPKDYAALAQSILYLLENKEVAKRIGYNGRLSVAESCNIERFVSRLSDLYLVLLSKELK